jgi:hypothetical protein
VDTDILSVENKALVIFMHGAQGTGQTAARIYGLEMPLALRLQPVSQNPTQQIHRSYDLL